MRLRPRQTAAGILIGVVGCGASPSVNILGSFFPAWLISIVVGVVLTVVVQQVLVAIDVAADLGPAAVVYPCLVGLLTLATWLVAFGSQDGGQRRAVGKLFVSLSEANGANSTP